MPNPFTWVGVVVFGAALSYDLYRDWFAPRLLSKPWIPWEPDLPPVAGEGEGEDESNPENVLLAAYLTGTVFFIIGALDVAPGDPACLPYAGFFETYVARLFAAGSALMWYSEGNNVTFAFYSEVRYAIGIIALAIPLYLSVCAGGAL